MVVGSPVGRWVGGGEVVEHLPRYIGEVVEHCTVGSCMLGRCEPGALSFLATRPHVSYIFGMLMTSGMQW